MKPSACITWFQANQACALAGKRLVRNDEWQRAAASTPDPGTDDVTSDCNVVSNVPVNTGSRPKCQSAWGAFDMVGNVAEWVADWADLSDTCTDWTATAGLPGGDLSCFGGRGGGGELDLPGAMIRGGRFGNGPAAGIFTAFASSEPSSSNGDFGFRCAR